MNEHDCFQIYDPSLSSPELSKELIVLAQHIISALSQGELEELDFLKVLAVVGVYGASGIEYLGNRLYEQTPQFRQRDTKQVGDRCFAVTLLVYSFAFKLEDNQNNQRRLYFKQLILESLQAGLQVRSLEADAHREKLKLEYDRGKEAGEFLHQFYLPDIDPQTLPLAERAEIFLTTWLDALRTLSNWPIEIRQLIYQRMHDEYLNVAFELQVHPKARALTNQIYQSGLAILNEYLKWLLHWQLIELAGQTASTLAALCQHRLQDLDQARIYYRQANDLIMQEIDDLLDRNERKKAIFRLYDQAIYLRILRDREELKENLDLTVRLLLLDSSDYLENNDNFRAAETVALIAFKILIAGQLVGSPELHRMSSFYFQKSKILWSRSGHEQVAYRVHEADGFGAVAIARTLLDQPLKLELNEQNLKGLLDSLSRAIYHLEQAYQLTFSDNGAISSQYGDAAVFHDAIRHLVLASQEKDVSEILMHISWASENFQRVSVVVANKTGVHIAAYYYALLDIILNSIRGQPVSQVDLELIAGELIAQGHPYGDEIIQKVQAFLDSQQPDERGILLLNFLQVASTLFLYLPTQA